MFRLECRVIAPDGSTSGIISISENSIPVSIRGWTISTKKTEKEQCRMARFGLSNSQPLGEVFKSKLDMTLDEIADLTDEGEDDEICYPGDSQPDQEWKETEWFEADLNQDLREIELLRQEYFKEHQSPLLHLVVPIDTTDQDIIRVIEFYEKSVDTIAVPTESHLDVYFLFENIDTAEWVMESITTQFKDCSLVEYCYRVPVPEGVKKWWIFFLDSKTRTIIGREDWRGNQEPLNNKDLELCQTFKLAHRIC